MLTNEQISQAFTNSREQFQGLHHTITALPLNDGQRDTVYDYIARSIGAVGRAFGQVLDSCFTSEGSVPPVDLTRLNVVLDNLADYLMELPIEKAERVGLARSIYDTLNTVVTDYATFCPMALRDAWASIKVGGETNTPVEA